MMSELFDDVQAAAQVFSKDLTQTNDIHEPEISALERGQRQRPDGTRETYERIEFRPEGT